MRIIQKPISPAYGYLVAEPNVMKSRERSMTSCERSIKSHERSMKNFQNTYRTTSQSPITPRYGTLIVLSDSPSECFYVLHLEHSTELATLDT